MQVIDEDQANNMTEAEKEIRLAQELDENDPTAWLYSALIKQQNNYLRKHMKLEADPTVQYAIPNGPKRRLVYSDLKYPSPYNTYLHRGLPPGPINNPGLSSIIAAISPEKNNYLYFVAKGF